MLDTSPQTGSPAEALVCSAAISATIGRNWFGRATVAASAELVNPSGPVSGADACNETVVTASPPTRPDPRSAAAGLIETRRPAPHSVTPEIKRSPLDRMFTFSQVISKSRVREQGQTLETMGLIGNNGATERERKGGFTGECTQRGPLLEFTRF